MALPSLDSPQALRLDLVAPACVDKGQINFSVSGCFGLDRKIKMITENQSTIVDGD